MAEVPVIDITPFRTGTKEEKLALATEVDKVCREIGFMSIIGHGIDTSVIDNCWREIAGIFDLRLDEKLTFSSNGNSNRGYIALGGEALAYTLDDHDAPPDMFEAFNIGHPTRCTDAFTPTPTEKRFFEPNIWTSRPEVEAALRAYYGELEKLGLDLMCIFALALGLDEFYFDRFLDRHLTTMRMLNYPEPKVPPLEGQLRIGEHSDYGSLTILRAEPGKGGLEVHARDGSWVPVMPRADAFIINLGDLMAFWTNDRWVSTLHRVVVPPEEAWAGSRRQSIAFFHHPNADALISPVPTCVDPSRTVAPVTSGDWLIMKLSKQTVTEERATA